MVSDQQINARFDWLKWLVIVSLLVAGLIGSHFYSYQPWPIRLLGWLFLLTIIIVVALKTNQGKRAFNFARESRIELRKVYWPTRQETIQTTFLIAIMVVVLALILWGVDDILYWLIGWLTGQRG